MKIIEILTNIWYESILEISIACVEVIEDKINRFNLFYYATDVIKRKKHV